MADPCGRYDLHLHTTWSDGTDTVADVVAQVAEHKLAGFSIADHDTVASQDEAALLAADFKLDYLTGLELSVTDGDADIHILVYGYDPEHDELLAKLEQFQTARVKRAIGMAEKLQALGCKIDIADLLVRAGPGSVGRPHLARELVRSGSARSVREAFDRYLAAGKPAYLPKFKIDPAEGIALARRASGVTVLAHPASYPFEVSLAPLLAAGLQGIETAYPNWDDSTSAYWQALARKHKLLETGGSDYHGSHRPGVRVGSASVSREMYQRLLTADR